GCHPVCCSSSSLPKAPMETSLPSPVCAKPGAPQMCVCVPFSLRHGVCVLFSIRHGVCVPFSPQTSCVCSFFLRYVVCAPSDMMCVPFSLRHVYVLPSHMLCSPSHTRGLNDLLSDSFSSC
uniref:Uncharacterized protein n=1 Tax=Catharus ustulatus TaxID=91951 RepID=A0A8C3Y4A8_CATUS